MRNFTDSIEIEYVTIAGGYCVLPSERRAQATIEKIKEHEDKLYEKVVENATKAGEPVPPKPLSTADAVSAGVKEARAQAGEAIQRMRFNFRSYTHGEKLEAKRKATNMRMVNDDERFEIDGDEYELLLVCASTGQARDDIADLPPTIYEALKEEVFMRTNMTPEKIAFFR